MFSSVFMPRIPNGLPYLAFSIVLHFTAPPYPQTRSPPPIPGDSGLSSRYRGGRHSMWSFSGPPEESRSMTLRDANPFSSSTELPPPTTTSHNTEEGDPMACWVQRGRSHSVHQRSLLLLLCHCTEGDSSFSPSLF